MSCVEMLALKKIYIIKKCLLGGWLKTEPVFIPEVRDTDDNFLGKPCKP